jgi:hypothetical protein
VETRSDQRPNLGHTLGSIWRQTTSCFGGSWPAQLVSNDRPFAPAQTGQDRRRVGVNPAFGFVACYLPCFGMPCPTMICPIPAGKLGPWPACTRRFPPRGRHAVVDLVQRRWFQMQHPADGPGKTVGQEGMLTTQHLVENQAQRKKIRPSVVDFLLQDLRSHVTPRPAGRDRDARQRRQTAWLHKVENLQSLPANSGRWTSRVRRDASSRSGHCR